MPSETLTEREAEALDFIRVYFKRNKIPPTLSEIGQALGTVSRGNVHRLCSGLEHKGMLERRDVRGHSAYWPIPQADM